MYFFDNAKGFPLCESCYIAMQKGIKFIEDKLDYHISVVRLDKERTTQDANIRFWLSLRSYRQLLVILEKTRVCIWDDLVINIIYYSKHM